MCLAIPALITQIHDRRLATAEYNGNGMTIDLGLVDAVAGDYVLVHAGCAVERIDPAVAADIFTILAELAE